MIVSINFAILTFLKLFGVGRNENLFIFFRKEIKIAGSHKKTGSVGLAETQVFV